MGTDFDNISDELLAEFLDGNASHKDTQTLLDSMACDNRLQEFMNLSIKVDTDIENTEQFRILPMTAMAANNNVDNLCAIYCERLILSVLGFDTTTDSLIDIANRHDWLRDNGMPLHHIGRIAETFGITVTRQYHGSIDDIQNYLDSGKQVLAVIDKDTLFESAHPDNMKPDHVVVITAISPGQITLTDPSNCSGSLSVSVDLFRKAWDDSCNYLVIFSDKIHDYEPNPIDLSDVELGEDLIDLREAIAENAHEVWAANRKKEGWTYGPVRDDEKKQHPDMVAYCQLPDSEKLYDREMAINTIKLVRKLGYDIIKRK